MKYQYLIVERPVGFNEQKDCTVRALANSTERTYEEAYQLLKEAGRKDRRPTRVHYDLYAKMASETNNFNASITVAQFIKTYPDGNWIVQISGHVFAVVGGVIIDNFKVGIRSRVKYVWQMNKI